MATKLLKASSDEGELNVIKERLAQMSQRATSPDPSMLFWYYQEQILVFILNKFKINVSNCEYRF